MVGAVIAIIATAHVYTVDSCGKKLRRGPLAALAGEGVWWKVVARACVFVHEVTKGGRVRQKATRAQRRSRRARGRKTLHVARTYRLRPRGKSHALARLHVHYSARRNSLQAGSMREKLKIPIFFGT
jgi:hypothetical protein